METIEFEIRFKKTITGYYIFWVAIFLHSDNIYREIFAQFNSRKRITKTKIINDIKLGKFVLTKHFFKTEGGNKIETIVIPKDIIISILRDEKGRLC